LRERAQIARFLEQRPLLLPSLKTQVSETRLPT